MRPSLRALVYLVLLASAHPSTSWAAEKVDVVLLLASDVSRSITDEKFALERRGYAEALTDKRVLRAIVEGSCGQIAVAFVVGASGFSYEEAGEIMGVAVGTVKSRVHRAR